MADRIRGGILTSVFLLLLMPTPISAELGPVDNRLNLTCSDEQTCQLTNLMVGIDTISNQENGASPLSPEIVRLEFVMSPPQEGHALIPEILETLVIELDIEEDPGSYLRPDLNIILALGPSTNEWTIQGQSGNPLSEAEEYRLEDEALDLSNGRLLSPGDLIQITLTFEIDRPVTWQLGLKGASYVDIPVQWNLIPSQVDVDEPSSMTEPVAIEIGENVNGALIEADIDCFTFSAGERTEELRVHIEWSPMPAEIAVSVPQPELTTIQGVRQPAPSVQTTERGDIIESTLRWKLNDRANLRICIEGEDGRFGIYSWIAEEILAGSGANEASDFELDANWPTGTGWIGSTEQTTGSQGVGGIASLSLILFALPLVQWIIRRPAAFSWSKNIGLPVALVFILLSASVSPTLLATSNLPDSEEKTIDDLIDERLDAIVTSIEMGEPDFANGFFATKPGDRFQLRLHVDKVHSTGDGRYQIQTEELRDIDIDRAIFDAMRTSGLQEGEQVLFVLQAGRLLSLDLLMLEASLVVTDLPIGDVIHIDWIMVESAGQGSVNDRAWMTRPSTVDLNDWVRFTTRLIPEMISISYCNCGLDAVDVSIRTNLLHTAEVTPNIEGIRGASNPTPMMVVFGILGYSILLILGSVTWYSEKAARKVAENYV